MVNAINVFDQINSHVECPWFKTFHFKSLSSALGYDNIRKYLGLKNAEKYAYDAMPISNNKLACAEQLMFHLCGRTLGDKREESRNTSRKVRSDDDIKYLDEVYGNPKALERLDSTSHENARSIYNWMRNYEDRWETKRRVDWLHSDGLQKLKEIKDNNEEICAADIQVAYATY